MWQNTAFILIGLGILVLIGWGVKGFFMAADIPPAYPYSRWRHRGRDTGSYRFSH
jgi:hypothetical protein